MSTTKTTSRQGSRPLMMYIDEDTDEMFSEIMDHYVRNQSDTVRWLIREEHRRIFGNGEQPQPTPQEAQA